MGPYIKYDRSLGGEGWWIAVSISRDKLVPDVSYSDIMPFSNNEA